MGFFFGGFLVMVGLIAVDRGLRWSAKEVAEAIREGTRGSGGG